MMSDDVSLLDDYDALQRRNRLNKDIPEDITANLAPSIELRPYQSKALERFLFYMEDEEERPQPTHLLFHMATGSGKTVLMAALSLSR